LYTVLFVFILSCIEFICSSSLIFWYDILVLCSLPLTEEISFLLKYRHVFVILVMKLKSTLGVLIHFETFNGTQHNQNNLSNNTLLQDSYR
jgi:hypothetical protein